MRKVRIKIGKLFDALNIALEGKQENHKDIQDQEIFIKGPNDDYVKVNFLVRKQTKMIKIYLETGDTFVCARKHIIASKEGMIFAEDATSLVLNDAVTNVTKIEDIEETEAFDVSLDYPHLYKCSKGFIHHNTLLAIAAGLAKVTDEFVYRKVLVSRPVFPMGKDIGFLPGDINEKLAPYMQPIYDNIEYLMSGYSADGSGKIKKTGKKKTKKEIQVEEEKEVGGLGNGYLELLAAGILQVEPLLYIRGRSIPKQFLIVDEAQNLTPHEIKTIITRAGEGTKIVVTGDPYQIDNPFVDASSNGLTYIVERFKDQAIAGHITLVEGVRSELAEIASNIL